MTDRTCLDCRFFVPDVEGLQVMDYGQCRFAPPTVLSIEDEPVTFFPQIEADAFCGQWSAKQ